MVLIAEAEGSPWTLLGMPVLGEAEMECACFFTNGLTALVRLVGMPFTHLNVKISSLVSSEKNDLKNDLKRS